MEKYKYPRTYHFPFSPGIGSDDKVISDLSVFEGKEVVVTEKMDGENTTIYPNGECHARSIDSSYHPSRSWIKSKASEIAYLMEGCHKKNWRITGENLYAKHSIHYKNLESYFYMFGFWETDFCLNWDYTTEMANICHIPLVPVIYRGVYDELLVRALGNTLEEDQEGFVMRVASNIHISDWSTHVAKWVRPNHVQTDEHWMHTSITRNELA